MPIFCTRQNVSRAAFTAFHLVGAAFASFQLLLFVCCAFAVLQSCRIMYDLPGPDGDSGVLVDLIDDEDLEMMWEEFDSYTVSLNNF
jgi:hypothetical protein